MQLTITLKTKLLFRTLPFSLLIGCGGSSDEASAITSLPVTYVSAKQTWNTTTPPNYRFTLTQNCFCLQESPIVVTVQDGKVIGGFYADSLTGVSKERLQRLPTLTGLFLLADDAYAKSAVQVDVTFNQSKGYLESLYIDYSRMIADDEVGYRVSDFSEMVAPQTKVSVVKSMNSRQCESGGKSLASLQQELAAVGVPVMNASCGVDGNIYPTVCGAGDGRIGIFDIWTGQTAHNLPEGFSPLSNFPKAQVLSCN